MVDHDCEIIRYIERQRVRYLIEISRSQSYTWMDDFDRDVLDWCEDTIRDSFMYSSMDEYRESSYVVYRRLVRYTRGGIVRDTLDTIYKYLLSRGQE